MTIRFNNNSKDTFYKDLQKEVKSYLIKDNFLSKAKILLWVKLIFYSLIFFGSFGVLITVQHDSFSILLVNYIILGLSGILLAFNAAHDASHGTFSRKAWINDWIYHLTFNLQGVNAYLWKIRHISSHHLFPNVDGCDADIDDNFLIKLSPSKATKGFHRFQHWYATLLYCFYTMHWILIKDFIYLSKTELANLKQLKYPKRQVVALVAWKLLYFTYMLAIPIWLGYQWQDILLAFVIMHVFISIFFVWTLIISHLTMETQFHLADDKGVLPFDFALHQLTVSLDYHPTSYLANWIFGGFNSHAAHHLFPHLPHTAYVRVTRVIKKLTASYGYPYNELPIPKAIASHYRFLKKIGTAQPCFNNQ